MFWHLILVLFSPVYLMFALLFRDDRARLMLALHQQVLVLQRQLGKRSSLVPGERLALVLSGLLLRAGVDRHGALQNAPTAVPRAPDTHSQYCGHRRMCCHG